MSQESTATEHYMAAETLPLEDVLELLDQLHSAATEGNTTRVTGMSDADALGYLHDIIYTAQEAVQEIQAAKAQRQQRRRQQPVLRIVEKIKNHKAG
jgi:hypothetical protein